MNVALLTIFASEETTGIGALGLDWKVILLQAGAFIILYLIFKKYALGKVVKTLNDRHEKIEESLKTVDEIEKRSEQINKDAQKIISKARKEADEIIEKAHMETSEMLKKAEADASKKQEKIIIEAESKIKADIKKAKADLRQELLSLVAQATEVILGEKIDSKKDEAIIKKALQEVER